MPDERQDDYPLRGLRPEEVWELLTGRQGLDIGQFAGFMATHQQGQEDRELHFWPIIECRVPEGPIDQATQTKIEEARQTVSQQIEKEMDRIGLDIKPIDDDTHFRALTDILLKYATSPEQITRLIQGYVQRQAMLVIRKSFNLNVGGRVMQDPSIAVEDNIIKSNPARWKTLTECARIPEWIVFRHALVDTSQFETYALEPGNDSLFTLLADPREVYLLDFDPEAEETEIPKIERKTPEAKRMTPQKLSRFFQLPGLQRLIDIDTYERRPAAIGTNLTVLAEYFCENDDVIYRNRVTPEDVQKWLDAKFKKHNPPLEVAWYIWAKLNGTIFESASAQIEQYILDVHAAEHPWLFDLGLKTRNQCRSAGSLFELYKNASLSCKYSLRQADKDRYADLCAIFPSIYLLQTSLASNIYGRDENIRELLSYYTEHDEDMVTQYKGLVDLDPEKDSFELLTQALQDNMEPPHEWRAVEGFELLDPIEIYKCKTANKQNAISGLATKVLEKLKGVEDARVLKKFKREVIDKLPPVMQKVLRKILEEIATPLAAKILFEQADDDTIVAIARKEVSPALPGRIILPGDVDWHELVGRDFDTRRLSTAAEYETLRRSLRGARGADEITAYLMSHVASVRPSEVVRPTPDSPHDQIVREYGGSPDLLSHLDMATLLTYLGYSQDEILTETKRQAALSAESARPELAAVGVESELVGNTPEGQIINPERYRWLFNVLPKDLKDTSVNETMTPPTTSPVMQAMLLSLITDPRFGFVNADQLWEQSARPDRSPSSLHLNISIPAGLPFTPDLIHRYMFALQRMQWLAHGGDTRQRQIAQGRVSGWRPFSLLDVTGNADKATKVEVRNLALEQDGSHITNMRQLQLLASACIQLMREQAGLKLTQSGKVMAQIYQRFQFESQNVRGNDEKAIVLARGLIERYSAEIEKELRLPRQSKTEGIVVVKNL